MRRNALSLIVALLLQATFAFWNGRIKHVCWRTSASTYRSNVANELVKSHTFSLATVKLGYRFSPPLFLERNMKR